MTGDEITPRDALAIAQDAVSRINDLEDDLEELQKEHEDALDDVAALKFRLSELDDERDYPDYTLDEKIGMVREHAFRKATQGHGKATLDYDDVMWEVFDGEPGAAHCYKLMRQAAESRGFTFRNPDSGNKHLAVDAGEAKRGAPFFSEKKVDQEGSAP